VLSVVQAVREMLQTHPQVQSDSVIVQFSEFGEHALNVRIVCFMKTPAWNDFQAARQDINLKIMQIMEKRGVEFGAATFEVLLGKIATPSPQGARLTPQPEPTISDIADSPVPDDAAN
jgi:MscS family membrane protein